MESVVPVGNISKGFDMKKLIITLAALILLVAYTRVIWLSGFDQGAAVAMCTIASILNEGELAEEEPSCVDVKSYESNPLWQFRRRGPASE